MFISSEEELSVFSLTSLSPYSPLLPLRLHFTIFTPVSFLHPSPLFTNHAMNQKYFPFHNFSLPVLTCPHFSLFPFLLLYLCSPNHDLNRKPFISLIPLITILIKSFSLTYFHFSSCFSFTRLTKSLIQSLSSTFVFLGDLARRFSLVFSF